jgi:phospholipid/cholesterol/gamma-HCH transport system ATP-binding protein
LYQHSHLPARQIQQLVEEVLTWSVYLVLAVAIQRNYPGACANGVSFARAIIANPENPQDRPALLLYDEPTAGLDPIASTVIEDLIRNIQRSGGCRAYLIVTHQDSTIRRTADRIIFLHRGKIQWNGPVSEIDQTDNPYVRQFFRGDVEGPIQMHHLGIGAGDSRPGRGQAGEIGGVAFG